MYSEEKLCFVAIQMPGSPDQEVWDELDRRMEQHGYSKTIDGYLDFGEYQPPHNIIMPRGVYMRPLEPDDEGAVADYETGEETALECWPLQPIVAAFESNQYFGVCKEDQEDELLEQMATADDPREHTVE